MPARAHSRSVESFFADSGQDTGVVRVCRGLSCALNGAEALAAGVGALAETRSVYCLGYCDRSPSLLLPGGTVRFGADALAWPGQVAGTSPAVDVRATSRRLVVTERISQGNHASLARARQAGVYAALNHALGSGPESVLRVVEESGEQGRGGAGFPTGRKLRACAMAPGTHRYVVANGDEGDPGSFIDRLLLEEDPHAVLEGLTLCALAIGASEGIVFIRAEYPQARVSMEQAVMEAREAGLLGASVLGGPFSFDVRVVSGRGSYVCGEETALLNALEGGRGEVRVRPPYPVTAGLHGQPTAVNNIETLVNIPWIVREGAEAYRTLGTPASPGTKAFCLNRGFARPGIVEAEFGLRLRDLIEVQGGGSRDGRALAAVVVGGPMGSVLAPEEWDVALEYATPRVAGLRLGHGGLVAIPGHVDMRDVLVHWTEFMAGESCGKCVPCSAGSREALDLAVRLRRLPLADAMRAAELTRLMKTVETTSLCGFGQGIAGPISAVTRLALRQAGVPELGHG